MKKGRMITVQRSEKRPQQKADEVPLAGTCLFLVKLGNSPDLFFPLFAQNILIETKFICHKIHHFKVYNEVVFFSIFINSYNHCHCLLPDHFLKINYGG